MGLPRTDAHGLDRSADARQIFGTIAGSCSNGETLLFDLCAHDLARGVEVAGALDGKPLLLFHGDRDEWVPSVLFPS